MVLVLKDTNSVRAQSNELAADKDAIYTCACTGMRDLAGSTIKGAKGHEIYKRDIVGLAAAANPQN